MKCQEKSWKNYEVDMTNNHFVKSMYNKYVCIYNTNLLNTVVVLFIYFFSSSHTSTHLVTDLLDTVILQQATRGEYWTTKDECRHLLEMCWSRETALMKLLEK